MTDLDKTHLVFEVGEKHSGLITSHLIMEYDGPAERRIRGTVSDLQEDHKDIPQRELYNEIIIHLPKDTPVTSIEISGIEALER